jgi:L-histidine N-alpha-methyltransferase
MISRSPLFFARRCQGQGRSEPSQVKAPHLLQFAREDPAATRAAIFAGFSAPAGGSLAQVFLRCPGFASLFGHYRVAGVLPDPHRGEHFFPPHRRDGRGTGAGHDAGRSGAGNCEKAASLFAALQVQRYVAVDISASYLRDSLESLQRKHPTMEMLGIGLDFSRTLTLPAEVGEGPRTMFYPGSSIGNFTPAEALALLRQVHTASAGGALLIGVDLVKPTAILERAYDDPLGVTAAFNRNLLRHLNALFGTDFAIDDWRHVAFSMRGNRVSKCIWRRSRPRSCIGPTASEPLSPVSVCIPKIPTSGVRKISPTCSRPPVSVAWRPGRMKTAGSPFSGPLPDHGSRSRSSETRCEYRCVPA